MSKSSRRDQQSTARQRAADEAQRDITRRRVIMGSGIALVVAIAVVLTLTLSSSSSSNKVAGLVTFPETNHHHVTRSVTYDHTPPAGGAHDAVWLNCGVYDAPVRNENAVHSLEHGSIWITYQPSLPAPQVLVLRTYVKSHYDGIQRYLVLSPYPGLPTPVVVSAWGAQLRLPKANDPRLALFVAKYIGGNQGGEQGAQCTGGTGNPVW